MYSIILRNLAQLHKVKAIYPNHFYRPILTSSKLHNVKHGELLDISHEKLEDTSSGAKHRDDIKEVVFQDSSVINELAKNSSPREPITYSDLKKTLSKIEKGLKNKNVNKLNKNKKEKQATTLLKTDKIDAKDNKLSQNEIITTNSKKLKTTNSKNKNNLKDIVEKKEVVADFEINQNLETKLPSSKKLKMKTFLKDKTDAAEKLSAREKQQIERLSNIDLKDTLSLRKAFSVLQENTGKRIMQMCLKEIVRREQEYNDEIASYVKTSIQIGKPEDAHSNLYRIFVKNFHPRKLKKASPMTRMASIKPTMINKLSEPVIDVAWITKARRRGRYKTVTDPNVYNLLIIKYARDKNYRGCCSVYEMAKTTPAFEINSDMIGAMLLGLFEEINKPLIDPLISVDNRIIVECDNSNDNSMKKKSGSYESKKGKCGEGREKTMIQNLLNDAHRNNIDLFDIFKSDIFKKDEKEKIEKIIRLSKPAFTPPDISISSDYICNLLKPLNKDSVTVNPYHNTFNIDKAINKLHKQLEYEEKNKVVIPSIIPSVRPITQQVHLSRVKLEEHKQRWRDILCTEFDYQVEKMSKECEYGEFSLVPYLSLMPTHEYVDLMLQEVDMFGHNIDVYLCTLHQLQNRLAKKVHRLSLIQTIRNDPLFDNTLQSFTEYMKAYNGPEMHGNHRKVWMDLTKDRPMPQVDLEFWPYSIRKKVGKFLYNLITTNITVSPSTYNKHERALEAFEQRYALRDGERRYELLATPALLDLYSSCDMNILSFNASELPMLHPPVPWTNHKSGCHLLTFASLIRLTFPDEDQTEWLRSVPVQTLYPYLDGLNTLAACPWKVNKQILELVKEVFYKGGNTKLGVPKNQNDLKLLKKKIGTSATCETEVSEKEKREMYSLWCTELYKLSIAEHYKDQLVWFPYSVDFRGRTYPITPHFNHLGNDISRGLLMLGVGRPLGEKGLQWLKIHLVNLTGFVKGKSNEDRLKYAEEHMDLIIDSALRPFSGKKWWQDSDKPWQTLATCIDIHNATISPDHTKYISYIPVHQDGSCNGLQHYAALGRDASGARSVSLSPSDAPQDVYADVVKLMEEKRRQDIDNGVAIAKVLDGFVNRKLVKQTIMTSVYGVTGYGARKQIGGRLKNIEEFPEDQVAAARAYLTDLTFNSLTGLFTSSNHIQAWFKACASIILVTKQAKLTWHTPIGWLNIQPYVKSESVLLFDSLKKFMKQGGVVMGLNDHVPKKKVGRKKKNESKSVEEENEAFDEHGGLVVLEGYESGNKEEEEEEDASDNPLQYRIHPNDEEYTAKAGNKMFLKIPNSPVITDVIPNFMKQKNAFPPNLVHSLDSSHMFLTAIHCFSQGIPYASVHDCFWVNACNVEKMNVICREQFVALYTEPFLERLSDHFIEQFGYSQQQIEGEPSEVKRLAMGIINKTFRDIPQKGTFDITQVLKSTYFFS